MSQVVISTNTCNDHLFSELGMGDQQLCATRGELFTESIYGRLSFRSERTWPGHLFLGSKGAVTPTAPGGSEFCAVGGERCQLSDLPTGATGGAGGHVRHVAAVSAPSGGRPAGTDSPRGPLPRHQRQPRHTAGEQHHRHTIQ